MSPWRCGLASSTQTTGHQNSRQKSVLSCDALFISDLHLGSNQCEAGHLAAFLECIRPRTLFLVGDIIDLQAIRFNANVDASFLTDRIDALLAGGSGDPPASEALKKTGLLRASHRRVIEQFEALQRAGVAIVYIPGNHDAYLRRHAGLERPGFAIRRQAVYRTPAGQRLLVRHGDEYDRLIRFHADAAEGLARLQEHYSAGINGLLSPSPGRPAERCRPDGTPRRSCRAPWICWPATGNGPSR